MNEQQFVTELQKYNIQLSDKQLQQFDLYFKTLIEWNEKMNLTSIIEREEVYIKHFLDSISAAFHTDFIDDFHICDVGAGAGFPSLPLKICFPHLKVTIVDSLNKRINFLNHLASELGLDHVDFHHHRAEDFGKDKQFREYFDIVMARAVARMSVLSELCLPLCKINGHFIAMKGAKANEELDEAKQAINILGGEVVSNQTFTLPFENSERSIIIIEKKKKTPKKYPRKAGLPNKQPLGVSI